MLAKSGTVNICGFFLSGINEDQLSPAYKDYQPPPNFLNIPVWISYGDRDQIAPERKEEVVYFSIKRAGFKQVRMEQFFGGHQLKQSEVKRALKWFRELGKF
jgi:predicted esterase